MSKFGELIDLDIPVLLDFYTDWHTSSDVMSGVLRNVATTVGDKAKIIKIDVDKNPELAEALRVKSIPTLMIYKSGEMMWRQSGEQDATTLVGLLLEYVK